MTALERLAGSITEGATFKKGRIGAFVKHGTHNQKTHGRGGGGKSFGTLTDVVTHYQNPANQELTLEQISEMTTSQNPEYGQSAVFEYVNNSNSLNMALRADADFADEQFGPLIRDLDETMSRTPNITESITVYRGLAGGDNLPEGFDGLQAGDVFSDSAFVSTSLSPNSAIDFAVRGDGILFEIKVPANSEGVFPNSWLGIDENNFFDEFEFLLPRDSQFKVISSEGKVWKMELTNG